MIISKRFLFFSFCILFLILNFSGVLFPLDFAKSFNWQAKIIDSKINPGYFFSLALDSQDQPHLSYYNFSDKKLRYAYYQPKKDNWKIEIVEENEIGYYPSLALDKQNIPHLAYYDSKKYNLKYAYLDNGQWIKEIVDAKGDVGSYSRLVLDSLNLPHLSYVDFSYDRIKYAHKTQEGWQVEEINNTENGLDPSLALDSFDNPHLSFHDSSVYGLKYAYKLNNLWKVESVSSQSASESSLRIDSSNNPRIIFSEFPENYLKYAYKSEGDWEIKKLTEENSTGISFVLDSFNNPAVSYLKYNRDKKEQSLNYLYKSKDSWKKEVIEPQIMKLEGGDYKMASATSLALDSFDNLHLIFYDAKEEKFKYLFGFKEKIKLSNKSKNTNYQFENSSFTFLKLPKIPRKYQIEINKTPVSPEILKRNEALSHYWEVKTNLNKSTSKFKIKMIFQYTDKELKNLQKENKEIKEKDLVLKVYLPQNQKWVNLKAKHYKKRNIFKITFNYFKSADLKFAIGKK